MSPLSNNTVEPPNKGHIGDNVNSAVLSFVEGLSCQYDAIKRYTGRKYDGYLMGVLQYVVQRPTVHCMTTILYTIHVEL